MSSTNRGYDRHTADYYVTPKYVVKDFLSQFLKDEHIDRPDRLNWLDPCCGGDSENEATYMHVINEEFETKSILEMSLKDQPHYSLGFLIEVRTYHSHEPLGLKNGIAAMEY